MTGFWDTLAGVAFTAALLAMGWVVRQLFMLTSLVSALTATVRALEDDLSERVERLEDHAPWAPRGIIGPSQAEILRRQRRERQ